MLSPASMEELPDEVVQLNDLVAERLPRVELAEVLIEVDSWTGFTQFFRHAGGARSRNPDLVRHVYAAILAQACNFGLTTMADIADLTYRQLAWTTDWYLREKTLKAAFSALVDFQHQLPLAEAWGGGTLSSSDGQRFPVRGSAENATALPKYFGLGRGLTFWHCHVNRVGPQRPAWIPFQAAALALSHTLNASFRNRLNVNLLRKCRWT